LTQIPDPPFGGNLRWFGESWGAPVCEPQTHIETPVGMPCAGHEHLHPDSRVGRIVEGSQGITIPYLDGKGGITTIAFHLACWLHEVGADRLPDG